MKFQLVLTWAVLFLIIKLGSTTSSAAAAAASNETYNLINSTNLAKPGCEDRCGDVIVPYPFGMNSTCAIDESFEIYCDTSVDPPRATFTKDNYNSIRLISDSTLRTSNLVAKRCSFQGSPNSISISFDFRTWPAYTFSEVNKFTVIGCGVYAWLNSATKKRNVSTGCMVFCSKPDEVVGGECSGNGCCESPIPKDINYYTTQLDSLVNSGNVSVFAPCTYAFVGEENVFKFDGISDLTARDANDNSIKDRIESSVPIVLDWAIGNLNCSQAAKGKINDFACRYGNSTCVDATREAGGYRCVCKEGYEGNPYLPPGCQDINECDRIPCYGTCVNTIGNYTCECKKGYSGDATVKDGCRRKPFNVLHLSLGLGLGILTLLIGLFVLLLLIKQRKLIKQREKFFEQNGGVLLEEKLKTTGSTSSGMKIFQIKELEEATNNYAEDNILGSGGNGTVYKGTLPDTRLVAIKKSLRLDQGQRDQFINEMVILAQINHVNVVQLLGCCLETEVPMLAYEFVSNDTLYRHIHKPSGKGRLSWDCRLKIAHESASALAFLHNDARMSIIHRDVKSTNILLDDNYTAKIADFGASRLVPLGHDQVTTLVQGTIGYLDPEYFQTGHLTDKSDVYSFGVVLAELLTGKKTIDPERGFHATNLATYFLKAKKENRLLEILDHQVIKEATDEQIKASCDLVCRCLNQVGENRPSMKDVALELNALRKSGKQHPWISQENYTETSSLMIETEEHEFDTLPLVANSDTFGGYSLNTTGMDEIMLHVHSPR